MGDYLKRDIGKAEEEETRREKVNKREQRKKQSPYSGVINDRRLSLERETRGRTRHRRVKDESSLCRTLSGSSLAFIFLCFLCLLAFLSADVFSLRAISLVLAYTGSFMSIPSSAPVCSATQTKPTNLKYNKTCNNQYDTNLFGLNPATRVTILSRCSTPTTLHLT